ASVLAAASSVTTPLPQTAAASSAHEAGQSAASPGSPSTGSSPAWATRMKRSQTLSHGASTVTHAVRSGDHGGGGASVDLSEKTPYQRAAQVWDERIGSARVQASNWRLMALGCLMLSGGLACGLVWQSVRGTVTPWVVQVDRLGLAQAVAPADSSYQPTDPQIAFHLA
ncbi:hypothetical protein KXV85_003714, partial [Aspergillus fumigatus]